MMEQERVRQSRLSRKIAPLMRFVPEQNAHVLRFEIHTEELLLALLEENQEWVARIKEQILDDLQHLPKAEPEVETHKAFLNQIEHPTFWAAPNPTHILQLQKEIAPLMKYRMAEQRTIVKLRLPDQIQKRRWITYGPANEGMFVENYRAQVEIYVQSLAEQEVTLAKLKRQEQLTADEVAALATLLNQPDLFIREEVLQQVYEHPEVRLIDFLRAILENSTSQFPSRVETIEEAFQQFLAQRPRLTQAQRQFVYALRSLVRQQALSGVKTPLRTEQFKLAPFNRIGRPENLFSVQELENLLQFANQHIAQVI